MDPGAERLVSQQSKVANKVKFLEDSRDVGCTIQCNFDDVPNSSLNILPFWEGTPSSKSKQMSRGEKLTHD